MSEPERTTIMIETPGLTIRVDGTNLDLAEVMAAWRELRDERRIEGGSVTGFQIEQASEDLHDRLPGGWAR